jgi:MFS family permease
VTAPRTAEPEGDRPAGFVDRMAKREYLRLGVTTFFVYFLNQHQAILAVVFERHGIPLPQIGLLLSLYGVPVVIITFLTGAISGWIGSLNAARLGMAVMVLSFSSLQWTASSFWPALGSRLAWGIGYGLLFSPLMTYAQSRLTSERFVYLLGVFSSMAPLAQAFAPPWAEWVLAHGLGDYLFFIGALPAAIGLTLTWRMRPLDRPATTSGLNLGSAFSPSRRLPLFAIFISGAMFGFLGSYLAAFLHQKGVSIAWFFIASTAAMFASRFLAMNHIAALDGRVVVGSGFGLMAAGFIVVAFFTDPAVMALGGFLFGTGYSVVYPILSAWISRGLGPSDRAGPQAVFNAIFNIGILWVPLPMVAVITLVGYQGAILTLAALGIVIGAGLVALGLRRATTTG